MVRITPTPNCSHNAALDFGSSATFFFIFFENFIFLRAGYSTHKRFVLGGAGCAAPFSSKTVVAYYVNGCFPFDKGEIDPNRWRRQGTQVCDGRVQSRLQHSFRTRLSAKSAS